MVRGKRRKQLINNLDLKHPSDQIPLTLNQKVNESILLTKAIAEFRNTYPELIDQWERQIGYGICHPDLHFCLNLLDGFPILSAYLRMKEYRIDFAINAYIVHSNWQSEFIGYGYDGNIALELANREIKLTYKALNESDTIVADPKAKVYHAILNNSYSSNF